MSREYKVQSYQDGDEQGIVDLLKLTFPDWAKLKDPVDYWRWKYLENPNGSVIYIAKSGDRVVGSNHAILLNVKVGNQTFKGRYGDDAATHPDFRGLGVYTEIFKSTIRELRFKGNEMNYDIPVNEVIVKFHLKEGRKFFPHPISHMIRVKDVDEYFKRTSVTNAAVKRYLFSVLKKTNWLSSRNSRKPRGGGFEVVETQLFDERVDALYDLVKGDYYFIVEKNRSYLNWRYCDARAGRFRVKLAVGGGAVLGYCVTQVKGEDAPEGYIVDLLTLSDRLDVASALIQDACEGFDKQGLNAVNYRVVKGHKYSRLASSLGFIDTRGNLPVMIDCGTEDVKKEFKVLESSSPSHTHFTYGDYY